MRNKERKKKREGETSGNSYIIKVKTNHLIIASKVNKSNLLIKR